MNQITTQLTDEVRAVVEYEYTNGIVYITAVEAAGSFGSILPALNYPVMNRIRQECETDALAWTERQRGVA
jgi:hypothetical protein